MILADDIENDLIENVINRASELLEELAYEFSKTWDDLKKDQISLKNSLLPTLLE